MVRHAVAKTPNVRFEDRLFHVLSYARDVLLDAAALNGPSRSVTSLSLSTLTKTASLYTAQRTYSTTSLVPRSPIPSRPYVGARTASTAGRSPLSLADAIALTKRLLQEGGYNSPDHALSQTQLRPRLVEAVGSKARKDPLDPQSVSLISDVVRMGESEGWLERCDYGKSGTERMYLKVSKPDTVVEVSTAPTSSRVPALSEASKPDHTQEPSKPGRLRTLQIKQCLKDAHLYSPKDVRELFFEALREIAPNLSSAPMTAGRVLGKALKRAKEVAAAQNVSFQNWSHAADGMLNTALAAGVLLGHEGGILNPSARTEMVSAIDTVHLVDRCESFMLKYVIKALGDITVRDRTALAFALFKEAPSKTEVFEMQQRVDELLALLQGEVTEGKDGLFRIDEDSKGETLAVAAQA